MNVANPPDGQPGLTACLVIAGAAKAIDWYIRALGARELFRIEDDRGVGHALLGIGGSTFALSDEYPEMEIVSPKARGGTTVSFKLFVDDVDAAFVRAIAAGATGERAVDDQFYGDRSGTLIDPFGHRWTLATHIEDVSPAEMQRRYAALPSD